MAPNQAPRLRLEVQAKRDAQRERGPIGSDGRADAHQFEGCSNGKGSRRGDGGRREGTRLARRDRPIDRRRQPACRLALLRSQAAPAAMTTAHAASDSTVAGSVRAAVAKAIALADRLAQGRTAPAPSCVRGGSWVREGHASDDRCRLSPYRLRGRARTKLARVVTAHGRPDDPLRGRAKLGSRDRATSDARQSLRSAGSTRAGRVGPCEPRHRHPHRAWPAL